MAVRVLNFAGSKALNYKPDINRLYPKAVSDLKETILKSSGFQSDDVKLSGFDLKGALVGRSMEFDLEIDNKILPIKLLEDVNNWEYVDLPTFVMDDQVISSHENGLVEKKRDSGKGLPTLAPFQLAGPMELWIQDAKDMRLFLPHDVDAGELKKVMLADGAVVTVKGAKSVTLRHPIELPLPFNKTENGDASGLLTLGNHLRHACRTQRQLVSLRIVGPTSLNSPATPSPAFNKLKLKRLAPGLVELSSASKQNSKTALSTIDLQGDVPTLLTPDRLTTFWPVASINGSNSNLRGLETLLSAVLDSMGSNNGSFKVLRTEISAQTFLKFGFEVEKKVTGNESLWEGYPEWRTKPESVVMRYEVLGKVDGEKILPEKVVEVDRVTVEDTVAPSVITGNVTMSKMPIVNVPFSPFAL
ncbi:hypothetical protein Ccrd_010708 [Cynara cardunculus var. scolymus]|uniref:Tunicamycin induced 1 n=1 Tax=Cynara cardunculus var. scolymus TaxID=59895 RepID=A0A103YKM0_CYNCS|nr:hypothetical protein Ccrd_010708 [Cynara cardunculus var. scolymus]